MRKNLIKFRGSQTQKQMGQMFGVLQQTWSEWERGKTTPTAKTLKKIAKAAGMTVDQLFFN